MSAIRTKGRWIAIGVTAVIAAIPSLDIAQAGTILTLLIAYIVATVAVLGIWKSLPSALRAIHIGVGIVAFSILVLIAEAVATGGEPSFPGWSDIVSPPGVLAFWAGLVLAIRARAAISRVGDVIDALVTALLPCSIVVFATYSYFSGTAPGLERAINGWFLLSDTILISLTLILIYGSGARNNGARWLAATGVVGTIYGLGSTLAIAQDVAWQGDLTRLLGLVFVIYAIATREPSYTKFASPGTRPQQYRWFPYPITGAALVIAARWTEPALIAAATAIFVMLCSARIAVNSRAASRLTKVTEVTGNLARELTKSDSLVMATAAGAAAARELLPGKRLAITSTSTNKPIQAGDQIDREATTIASSNGSTVVVIEGTVPTYLIVVFTQIADILDFSLPTIEERLRRVEQESTAAIRKAEEEAEAGWQALNVDSNEVPLMARNGRILRAAPNASTMVGFDPVGRTVDEIPALMHPSVGVDTFEDPGQPGRWLKVSKRHEADESTLYTIRDVTENVRSARTDPTTGLSNQSDFEAQDELSESTLSVIYLHDYDRVSEASGKAAGDALLKEIADRCAKAFRRDDQVWRGVGPKILVSCPYGEPSPLADPEAWLEKRRETLAAPIMVGNDIITPSITVGAAKIDEPLPAASALLRADMALNEARLKAPQSTRWYSEELRQAAKRSWSIETAFIKALADPEEGGFCVVYQPLVRTGELQPEACEALVRWNHPKLGKIGPDEFIPLAEEMGIVDEIDRFVLQTALRDIEQFHLFHPDFRIHVNLSPVGLNPQKLQLFSKALALHSTARFIVVEITESSIGAQDLTELQHACSLIRDTGVSLSLDDFGTGESNFDRISKLPLSEVKLSKHFAESGDPVMVESVIQTIHRLGMESVAENVETQEQVDMLTDAGADYLQGYFFSAPKSISEILDWMVQHSERPALSTGETGAECKAGDHTNCDGFWVLGNSHTTTCDCPCHATSGSWPGWEKHTVDLNSPDS